MEVYQDCCLGRYLQDECHKSRHCRHKGFIEFKDFIEEQKELLLWRSGIQNLSSDDKICFHHEKVFLTCFEYLQTACADPYGKHKNYANVSYLLGQEYRLA